jgi:hypothetical protein
VVVIELFRVISPELSEKLPSIWYLNFLGIINMMRKKSFDEKPVIDLTGPDGNAFALIAYANRYGKQLGYETGDITKEMMAGDYDNLLKVFEKYFGDYVILEY